MRKIIFGILGSLLISGLAFANFSDTQGHLFEEEISKAFQDNLINGYLDGTFKPDQPITRAEALKILIQKQMPQDYTSNKIYFSDVSQNDWFYNFVNYAEQNQIINGYLDGTFKPNNNISIAESLKILFQVNKVSYLADQSLEWFANLDRKAQELNLYKKAPNNFLNVNDLITRSELVYLIETLKADQMQTVANYNWNYENQDFSLKTLKSEHFYKLENNGILVLFEDGFLSFEIINNTFNSFEDSLGNFTFLGKDKIVESIFFKGKSLALSDSTKYYEQALDSDKNLIYRIKIEKNNGINQILNSLKFDTSQLRKFQKFGDLNQEIRNNLLIEGAFSQIESKITNKKIIYTDVIGIGMGPIDYIYLSDLNLTVKNERNTSTILQIKDGENSDF